MKRCCPECKSTNVATEKRLDGNSNCKDCKFSGPTSRFPTGFYQIPLPPLQEEIDDWCDKAQVTKEGYFYKNASIMCANVIDNQVKPWQDENKKLKLLIGVLEKKMDEGLIAGAIYNIKLGNDTIPHMVEDEEGKQVQRGMLILSYQHTNQPCEEVDFPIE